MLQVLYTIRSERMLMEQLDYNLLFRWFVGLNMDDLVWDATVFTKNRDRVLGGEVAEVGWCVGRWRCAGSSEKKRKLVEQVFGWAKTVGLMRKTRHRGTQRVDLMFIFNAAAFNLVRMRNLEAAT